jgi:2-isopropylmalate synthase
VDSSDRHLRYRPAHEFALCDRTWPDRPPAAAPRWLSTDLRDGNQALAAPMEPARKLLLFRKLVAMGYKEIEVGFPAAGRDEYDFVRTLIEQDLIPSDVRISVLVQAREGLIRRTVECLRGAPSAGVHLYNATAPRFRELVFHAGRAEVRALAVDGTRLVMKYADRLLGETDLGFQYSPELFNETEPDFALEVCEAVMDEWCPGPGREIILNFPATVERTLPIGFADRIEWLDRNLSRREHVCLSVHPHNDRGTAVAAAEFAVMAGAQRVEGCLFGGGERAGNVCLVTLGLNLYTRGIDPGIDFSDLAGAQRVVEHCTGTTVPERHPYGGALVYTAFSGSHQDAIKKGFDDLYRRAAEQGTDAGELPWDMPYLPLDPRDVGRDYTAVVRITSQSGKGGVGYVLSAHHGLNPPRELQAEFAAEIQAVADERGGELDSGLVGELFEDCYLAAGTRPGSDEPGVDGPSAVPSGHPARPIPVSVHLEGVGLHERWPAGLAPRLAALGFEVCEQRLITTERPPAAPPAAYAACVFPSGIVWGAGRDADPVAAAEAAVRSALARAAARHTEEIAR